MILQFLQKHFMLHHMQALQNSMDNEVELRQKGDKGALDRRDKTGLTDANLQNAKRKLATAQATVQNDPQKDAIFMPRDAVTSATQSILQDFVATNKKELVSKDPFAADSVIPFTANVLRIGGNPILDLFTHFGPDDIGWATCLVAEALCKADGGPHKFNTGPAPVNPIGNKARVILVADWGTGVPRAQDVGNAARRFVEEADAQGRDVHVIHLGDVYYAGFKHEYDDNFLKYWPVLPAEADKFASYNLNGNHDMYSGGFDYFDYLLADKRFRRQQQCSFFALENDFWQILGLDTAYIEGALQPPQADWVLQTRTSAPHKKGILLSHHQPFSAFEEAPAGVLPPLKPVLDQNLILAWWWGHEHRCAFYDPRDGVRYGRCIGYGGVPIVAESQTNPPGVNYQYQDFVPGGAPHFARFGFAVLDFNADQLRAQYLGENGTPHQQEDINATAGAAS